MHEWPPTFTWWFDIIRVQFISTTSATKGQMKSECIYEIIDFPKYHQKFLINFRLGMLHSTESSPLRIIKTNCMHLVYKTFQGRNPSKNLVVFWKINDFINTFWLHLTCSALSSWFRLFLTAQMVNLPAHHFNLLDSLAKVHIK